MTSNFEDYLSDIFPELVSLYRSCCNAHVPYSGLDKQTTFGAGELRERHKRFSQVSECFQEYRAIGPDDWSEDSFSGTVVDWNLNGKWWDISGTK